MFSEFRKFILRGNVVDLAVGVVIGAAFNSVVQSFVKDVVTPLYLSFGAGPGLRMPILLSATPRLLMGIYK